MLPLRRRDAYNFVSTQLSFISIIKMNAHLVLMTCIVSQYRSVTAPYAVSDLIGADVHVLAFLL